MTKFRPGIYEALLTEAAERELSELGAIGRVIRSKLSNPEAPDRLALHLAGIVQASIESLPDSDRVARGLHLARILISTLARELEEPELSADSPVLEDPVLRAIFPLGPDGRASVIEPPLTPLLDTTILTNSRGEPALAHEIVSEIDSAHEIDLIIAFVRRSGLRPFLSALRRHCESGRSLRLLTTTYTGSTELRALESLVDLGADVRVSYDTTGTRLHAKAWLFRRHGGISTAYLGSSNLTHQAQHTGLEWNLRISSARNRPVVEKMAAVFSSYWESGDFLPFDAAEFSRQAETERLHSITTLPPTEIRLDPFQERLLERVALSRERGHHANLLVSATGTGKTVMAAVDYARLRERLPRARLLFVAHTMEILRQSVATFRHALRDGDFGELWVGGEQPKRWDHVFASIQSLRSSGLDTLEPDHFDVIILDEIHHGAAPSFRALLDHVRPLELLGLTATPERADGQSILDWFGGRIAAELRLWDAIDQHRLVPFEYYGVHDRADLSQVRWSRGAGYDVDGLTNVFTANDVWARLVLEQLRKRVDDVTKMRALGFCVGIKHAQFMARVFNENGIRAAAVWGDSPAAERTDALAKLGRGEVNILFSVDLFNEGVDLPNVETLLLLRPTESPVLFLQQLGRGLRKAHDKSCCLVLDFVAQHRREFRYHARFQALLGGSRRHVQEQVEKGFPFLPAGCHMELEPVAREIVLRSIRNAVPDRWAQKIAELREMAAEGDDSLRSYLEHTGLDLEDVYRGNDRSWSKLREDAGLSIDPPGPHERFLRRACGRMMHIDDAERLDAYSNLLLLSDPPTLGSIESRDSRLTRMLVATVCDRVLQRDQSIKSGLDLLWAHPQVRSELAELLEVLAERVDHQHYSLTGHPDVPLQIHARYTRIEMLAALNPEPRAKVGAWQTGARWLPASNIDIAAFTLDKTRGQFSPTTRYRDYAISRDLIHWETQGVVRADSERGRRYRCHTGVETTMLLFARESVDERAFWFLGPATFVKFEGERPMAITWKLERPLPGDLFAAFAAAVA